MGAGQVQRFSTHCHQHCVGSPHNGTHHYGIDTMLHLLDDFLTIDPPDYVAERTMALLTLMFNRLGVPLAKHKCVGPTTCLE